MPSQRHPRACVRATRLLAVTLTATGTWLSPLTVAAAPAVSPVRVSGMITTATLDGAVSEAQLRYVAGKYATIVGLDNHGYTFPGLIDIVREESTEVTALCGWPTMDVAPDTPLWEAINSREEAFMHSTDPASLRVVGDAGVARIFFHADARRFPGKSDDALASVSAYQVEVSAGPGRPFDVLKRIQPGAGTPYLYAEDAVVAAERAYRVRSVLPDGRLAAYSWTAGIDPAAPGGVVLTDIDPYRADALALCVGPRCPSETGDLVLEIDANRDRLFAPVMCADFNADGILDGPAGCEQLAFTHVSQPAPGVTVYRVTPNLRLKQPLSYRVRSLRDPSLEVPGNGESYQTTGENNRLSFRHYGSQFIWPDDPVWREMARTRLSDCLRAGYDGMRVDFAMESLKPAWIASGLPSASREGGDDRIRAGVEGLLADLGASEPAAIVTFNGYWTSRDGGSYDRYLASASGSEFEFLAFGWEPGATEISPRTGETLNSMVRSIRLGKRVTALAMDTTGPNNTTARMKALALYLLVADDSAYFYFALSDPYLEAVYFPEWDVPLGMPVVPLAELRSWAHPSIPSLRLREFESGVVYFNSDATRPVTIDLDRAHYRLSVTGGQVPELGGDGQAHYSPVSQVTIGPLDVAILVRERP